MKIQEHNEEQRVINEQQNQQVQEQYLEVHEAALKQTDCEGSGCNPLLLPAFAQFPGDDVEVYIQQSTSDPVVNQACKIRAEAYINKIHKERNEALKQAQIYRNQVDKLRAKNRKLYWKMNDRVDIVRNFWRNTLTEGSTRAAQCALNRHRS